MSKNILVVVEHEEGKARRGSLEALALGRQMAAKSGGKTYAVVLGQGVRAVADELAARGADEVMLVEDAQLAEYTPDAYRAPVNTLVGELEIEWVLMGHTYLAQDVMPLVSAASEAPVLSDCVGVELEGEQVVFHRQPYDAKFVARTIDRGPAPHFATLQAGAFSADDLPEGHGGTVTERPAGLDGVALRRDVKEVRAIGEMTVDLGAAEVVVAGGRGMGSQEKFEELVGALAKALGGAIGASRPVVDSDWMPHDHQIGSSGQVITPKLYVALGISGAIQHVVGIRGAQTIVAINKDKDAPIFNEASYGIVGDINEVVPALVAAIEEANAE